MRRIEYSQLPTDDTLDSSYHDNIIFENNSKEVPHDDHSSPKKAVLKNFKLIPISKPPTKGRDKTYSVIFVLHFFIVIMIAYLSESKFISNSIIQYQNSGSWASMLMIATLLGGVIGLLLSGLISIPLIRTYLISSSVGFSIVLQVCLGNIILLLGSDWWILGIYLIISAISEFFWFKVAHENVVSTSVLIELCSEIQRKFGITLLVVCVSIIMVHTCLLLWWGAIFVGVISEVSEAKAFFVLFVLLASLYWVTQFFHSLMATVVSGAIMWYFLKDDEKPIDHTETDQFHVQHEYVISNHHHHHQPIIEDKVTDRHHKILLYIQCALTSSLGSMTKAALLSPPSQIIINIIYWCRHNQHANPILRNIIIHLFYPLEQIVLRNSRFAYSHIAIYGSTLGKASEDITKNENILIIAQVDMTHFHLKAIASLFAGIVAVLLAILAEREEGSSWPIFLVLCYFLAYTGFSLSLHIYSASVDALIVASVNCSENFAKLSPIIYHRFYRISEMNGTTTTIT